MIFAWRSCMAAEWIFDGVPPSGARYGGLAQAQVFDNDVDTFVREVLQNSRDQRTTEGQNVSVEFRLEDLAGPSLIGFLDALGWDQLEPHLEDTATQAYVTISPRIAEGLDEIRARGRLRVLRI